MSASSALTRRKAPDLVRQALLDATARVISQNGLAALTVQDVADAAGVSKGALFHHFSSKQALLDAALTGMLDDFEQDLRAHMQQAPASHGCFTRAYVEVTFDHLLRQTRDNDIGLTMANLLEPAMLARWRQWLRTMLAQFPGEADDPRLYTARCAADGYWATAYGRPLDEDERRNALAMATEAMKLCMPG